MNRVEYFKCYSVNLHRFLRVNDMAPLSRGVNKVTGKTYWVYQVDGRLSELLTIWSDNKPGNK